jgi:tripartite-type tricarboxylate transporter receptor subunit TctC
MPTEVTARLVSGLEAFIKKPAFQDKLAKLGLAVDYRPGAQFLRFMSEDSKKWAQMIPTMGIPQVD